jgi:hypothetical protein
VKRQSLPVFVSKNWLMICRSRGLVSQYKMPGTKSKAQYLRYRFSEVAGAVHGRW